MFKVGDIITGIPISNKRYDITNQDAIMKVEYAFRDGLIIGVIVIKHKNIRYVGEKFDVEAKYFRLAEPSKFTKFIKFQEEISC